MKITDNEEFKKRRESILHVVSDKYKITSGVALNEGAKLAQSILEKEMISKAEMFTFLEWIDRSNLSVWNFENQELFEMYQKEKETK